VNLPSTAEDIHHRRAAPEVQVALEHALARTLDAQFEAQAQAHAAALASINAARRLLHEVREARSPTNLKGLRAARWEAQETWRRAKLALDAAARTSHVAESLLFRLRSAPLRVRETSRIAMASLREAEQLARVTDPEFSVTEASGYLDVPRLYCLGPDRRIFEAIYRPANRAYRARWRLDEIAALIEPHWTLEAASTSTGGRL
jgi:hypothetical protein